MITDLYPEVLATVLLFAGLWLISPRVDWSRGGVRLVVAFCFIAMNARYVWWRFHATMMPLSLDPEALWTWLFAILELGATMVLTWHFIVLIKPTDRRAEADAAETRLRKATPPGVDVLIPTYNEPEDVLRRTILAARALDYPDFEVWVLDDGNRAWLRRFCAEQAVSYLVRPDRKGFKAGNLNHAIATTHRPVICVIDADFALKPNFLWRTTGLLLADPKVGIVQTPQVFSNPDAIQYNLWGEKAWPEAQCMFSDVMQSGRDTWDNAFCYGTGFVVRRACLEQAGGIPEATISEDLHTTYTLLSHGYKTRFLNEQLSSGLATQDIGEFVRQRARWCTGTLQCFFAEGGVLRGKRLSVLDRLFFLDPVLYHVSTLWTFCLMIAPAIYWWFGISPFHSDFGHLLVVFAPRMLLTIFGLYWLSERKTIPFVSEIGRAVGVFHLVPAVFRVLLNPFRQTFNTTNKKMDSKETQVKWGLMRPHLILLGVTLGGLMFRYLASEGGSFFMQGNVGLMISLTIYVMWLLFFCCLLCVQRPTPHGMLHTVEGARTGSIRTTLRTLWGAMFQWRRPA